MTEQTRTPAEDNNDPTVATDDTEGHKRRVADDDDTQGHIKKI